MDRAGRGVGLRLPPPRRPGVAAGGRHRVGGRTGRRRATGSTGATGSAGDRAEVTRGLTSRSRCSVRDVTRDYTRPRTSLRGPGRSSTPCAG